MQSVKCVLVGDGAVGKTCMLIRLVQNTFPDQYVPTVFDTYNYSLTVDDRLVSLKLWDTAGQEDYDRLRPLSYSNTNVFILCFGLDSPVSLENCSQKWIYELRHYTPESTPILLVGTKLDIRRQEPASCIHPEEGRKMVQELGLSGYAECSSRTDEGLRNVFIEAVRLVLKKPEQKREKRCFVL